MKKSLEQVIKDKVVRDRTPKPVAQVIKSPQAEQNNLVHGTAVNLTELFKADTSRVEHDKVNDVLPRTQKPIEDIQVNRDRILQQQSKIRDEEVEEDFAAGSVEQVPAQVAPDQVNPTKRVRRPLKSIGGPLEEKKKYTSVEKAKVLNREPPKPRKQGFEKKTHRTISESEENLLRTLSSIAFGEITERRK